MVKDYQYENGLVIKNGDFAKIQADQQHLQRIAFLCPGQLKYWPTGGAAFLRTVNARRATIQAHIRLFMESAKEVSFKGIRADYDGENINVDGSY